MADPTAFELGAVPWAELQQMLQRVESQVQAGDFQLIRRALLTLYDDALPVVYGYFSRRCADRGTAEDLTSETFLAAMDAARKDTPPPITVPWLLGVARYKLADHYRRRHDRFSVPVAETYVSISPLVTAARRYSALSSCPQKYPRLPQPAVTRIARSRNSLRAVMGLLRRKSVKQDYLPAFRPR